jgi:hypothetical protein
LTQTSSGPDLRGRLLYLGDLQGPVDLGGIVDCGLDKFFGAQVLAVREAALFVWLDGKSP